LGLGPTSRDTTRLNDDYRRTVLMPSGMFDTLNLRLALEAGRDLIFCGFAGFGGLGPGTDVSE
jgi:hypothetical protein